MPRYAIVSGNDMSEVADNVSEALRDGARLHGDLKVIDTEKAEGLVFVQALLYDDYP